MFDDLADAYAWLQHTRFSTPDDANAPRATQRQAQLIERVAALSAELAHYQQKAAQRANSPRKLP